MEEQKMCEFHPDRKATVDFKYEASDGALKYDLCHECEQKLIAATLCGEL